MENENQVWRVYKYCGALCSFSALADLFLACWVYHNFSHFFSKLTRVPYNLLVCYGLLERFVICHCWHHCFSISVFMDLRIWSVVWTALRMMNKRRHWWKPSMLGTLKLSSVCWPPALSLTRPMSGELHRWLRQSSLASRRLPRHWYRAAVTWTSVCQTTASLHLCVCRCATRHTSPWCL